jgi:hypothetical protein
VRYEFGEFPFTDRTPVEAMLDDGVVDFVLKQGGLEPHDPWNAAREATYLLRGHADPDAVNRALASAGFGWCRLTDNGLIRRAQMHAYHVAPAGTGKREGVRIDRERHGIDRMDAVYIGDGAADVDCAPEVGACWLVANAEAGLEWPHRTSGSYSAGVAELIERLLDTAAS